MSKLWNMLSVAVIMASAAIGLATSGAQAQTAPVAIGRPVPPRLSHAQAMYLNRHPTELAALKARLPFHRAGEVPVAAPPKKAAAVGGTWTPLSNSFPGAEASAPHLMLDGSLLVHDACTSNWYKLTPDNAGSYVNGTWTTIASMASNYTPLYFASQVLSDGRLIVNGGEYNNSDCSDAWTNLGAIYDPSTDTWQSISAPGDWTEIGDAQSTVLFNKNYMLADCCEYADGRSGGRQAILNTTTMLWSPTGAGKYDSNDEEGWSLLPTGNVFTGDAYTDLALCGKATELYNAKTGTWSNDGNSPVQLSDCSGSQLSYEVGPQMLRPNGTVVMFSGVATGDPTGTAIYNSATKKFTKGPNVPNVGGLNYTLADAPAALEPNGSILFAASPGNPVFNTPTHFFEFTPANGIQQISNDPSGATDLSSYYYNLLLLPTGQIFETDNGPTIQIYTPVGAPEAGVAPTITSVAAKLTRGVAEKISGKQLNGLSEAGGYGDDNQGATDYPLIRITNVSSGHVFFCKTSGQSSRDIAKSAATTANFVVPTSVEVGASLLSVVTNGIASASKNVTIQ